jgi:Cupin superfamily protein
VSELELMLDPVAPATFFRDHWDRKPLHIPGPPDKFAGVYDVETWESFEGVGVLKAVTTDADGVQVEMPIIADQAGTLFMAGMTICADVSNAPRMAPFLGAFRRELALPGGAPFAKLYASNDGKGFAVHADKHHVFVLQISGKKQWRFSRTPALPSPTEGLFLGSNGRPHWTGLDPRQDALRDDGTPVPPPDPAAFDATLLEPGHCLYLPPGTWHAARAIGHSIAVSISPQRTTMMELFERALHELFANHPEWRQDVIAPPDDLPPAGAIPASISRQLDARLVELHQALAKMDVRRLHRLWQRDVAAGQTSESTVSGLPPQSNADPIRRSDVFARAGAEPFRFIVAPARDSRSSDSRSSDEQCFFYYSGTEWIVPIAARAFLTELARHDEFRAESALAWDRTLRFDDVRDILGTLVAAGVLARRSKP